MRKKDLSEVMVRAVLSLYDSAKIRVRVGSAYSEKFEVKVGVHQGSVLSPLLFAIVVDVITENATRGVVNELLYADELDLMSETKEDLRKDFGIGSMYWKVRVKVNTTKTKGLVSGLEELFKSKIDQGGVCEKRVMANSVLCTKCGSGVQGRCAKIKRITAKLAMYFVC